MLARRRASSRNRAGSRGASTASAICCSPTVSICGSRRTARSTCTGICWRSAAGKAPTVGIWQRAQPMTSVTSTTVVPSPADLLFHICVHGLRWSPVHSGHWVADAARIIQSAGERLDWDVVVSEAARRRLGLQMTRALHLVRERGHVDVPQAVIETLERQPASWRDRLECRFKGRPVQSAGGLFVIWTAWRRSAAAARNDGRQPPPWTRFLAATLGVATPAALVRRFADHAWTRARAAVHRAPPRGASTRTRMVARR